MSTVVVSPGLVSLGLRVDSLSLPILLKIENGHPTGSLKHRTAIGLINGLAATTRFTKERILVESSSGNLGVALAYEARARGLACHIVTDPNIPAPHLRRITDLGATVEIVRVADSAGAYLDARLQRVKTLVATSRRYLWTNQYASSAGPAAHMAVTGPAVWRCSSGRCDAVFVAVSTGGTLAGVSRYLRSVAPQVRIVAVDVRGSAALGYPRGPRRLPGIGATRPSVFLESWMYDAAVLVPDARAVAFCRHLRASTGLELGGSGGAVLAACVHYVSRNREVRSPLCLCADDGCNYQETVYNESWMSTGSIGDLPSFGEVRSYAE